MNLVRFNKPVYQPTVSDLFNEFFNDYSKPVRKTVACNSPAVNVLENEKSFKLEFSVPGYSKENFEVKNTNGVLTVKAHVKEEENESSKEYTYRRFEVSSFERNFNIPEEVDVDGINAKYANGILTVELPKKEVEETNQEKNIVVE